jgi:hypothetical protein
MPAISSSATTASYLGTAARSFLDDLQIVHGPERALALYFLAAEKFLFDRGLRIAFTDFGSIARLNAEHIRSWDMLLPMLDPDQHPVRPEHTSAILAYDRDGTVVASMAARLFDFTGTTLKAEAESLRFYYGANVSRMASRVRSTISAPTAATMSGRSAYLGGYWLRPDVRSQGLSVVIPKLMRYIALTTWNANLEFSYGRDKFLRPEIAATYGFNVERDFTFYLDERLIWRGTLVWLGRDEMIDALPALIDAFDRDPPARPSVDHGRGNEQAATGAAR